MIHQTPLSKYIFCLLLMTQFLVVDFMSQTTIKGVVNDGETNEELIGATRNF